VSPVRTIAIGYDGSSGARTAARWALDLAVQLDAQVVLVHARGMLGRTDEERLLADLAESALALATATGLDPAKTRWHVSQGDPCSALLRAGAAPISADLIVVGSRGHRNDAGLPLGSTSHQLAEHSAVPLVIVPTPVAGSEGAT